MILQGHIANKFQIFHILVQCFITKPSHLEYNKEIITLGRIQFQNKKPLKCQPKNDYK